MLTRYTLWISLITATLYPVSVSATETISFLTYHNAPPFIVDETKQKGLTYRLAAVLTRASGGRYRFQVEVQPRLRLNKSIQRLKSCAVPWVNPDWFPNLSPARFKWTRGYFQDKNAVISHRQNPIEYQGATSLHGLKIAGLRGGKWVGLSTSIKAGHIEKIEVSNYDMALKVLKAQRTDGAIIPQSIARHLIGQHNWQRSFYFSRHPHSLYQRHFMVCKDPELFSFLQEQAEKLARNPVWLYALSRYHINPE